MSPQGSAGSIDLKALSRTVAAILFSFILILTGQVVAAPSAHAAIDGVTVSVGDTSGKTGRNEDIQIPISINCGNGCPGEVTVQLNRPSLLAPDARLIAANRQIKVADSYSSTPTLTFTGLSAGQNSFTVVWKSDDNPTVTGSEQYNYTYSYNGKQETGSAKMELTGTIENLVTKSADMRKAPVGAYVTYELQYIRKGTTGVTGVLVDTLPEGVELVRFLNPHGAKPEINPATGDVSNVGQVIVKDNSYMLSQENFTYDPGTRQIRVNVTKELDNAVNTPGLARFRIKYVVRTTQKPTNETNTWDNTWGWAPDGLKTIGGEPLTKNSKGVSSDASASVQEGEVDGSAGKGASGGALDPVTQQKSEFNHTTNPYFSFSAVNGADGPLNIVDEFRSQTCATWADAEYKSSACKEADDQANGGYYFQPNKLVMDLSLQKVEGADGQVELYQGVPAFTLTVKGEGGKEFVVKGEQQESSSSVSYPIELPADFVATGFTMDVENLLGSARQTFRVYGNVDVPEDIYAIDGKELDRRYIVEIANDATITYQQSEATESGNGQNSVNSTARLRVRESFSQPRHNIYVGATTFGDVGGRASLTIRPQNLAKSAPDSYRPYGVVAFPKGFTFGGPHSPNDSSANACVAAQDGKFPAGSELKPFDPRQVTWSRAKTSDGEFEVSPSGGEVWTWTVPEGMELPAGQNDGNCGFSIWINYDGAVAGNYNQESLTNKFSRVLSMITTADPKQPIAANTDNINNTENVGCEGPEGNLCTAPGNERVRWHPQRATLTVLAFGASTISKYAKGDKDETDQNPTQFLPGKDSSELTSYATKQVEWTIRGGAGGSNPIKDFVLYDALPAERWVPMNTFSGSQEEMAGTHLEFDDKGNITNESAVNSSTLIPTLTGPIALPEVNYLNDQKAVETGPAPATVWYTTEIDPCRPEMAPVGQSVWPEGSDCSTFNAKNQWFTAETKPDNIDWSQVRYFRVAFDKPLIGQFDLPFTMNMPNNDVSGDGIDDQDIAINRVANRSKSMNDQDLGTIKPSVARVSYVPEIKVNKSVIIPADGESFADAKKKVDGQDPADYLIGAGDFVYFQISVSTKNDAVLASPVIRDFIPAGLKYVGTEQPTVGTIYEDYNHDNASEISAIGESPIVDGDHIVWIPGKLTKTGVEENGKQKKAVVTLKLQVTGDAVGTVTNHVSGGSNTVIGQVGCEASSEETIESNDSVPTRAGSYGCDSQAITIAPSISGSLFNLGETTTGGIGTDTPKVTELQDGDIIVHLLDAQGNPVLQGGQPVTTVLKADGTYIFPKVKPGEYQVKFEVADNDAARKRFKRSFFFADAESGEPISAASQIDGGVEANNPFAAITPTFTVPGLREDGTIDGTTVASVPTVDFAVRAVKRSVTLTKSADEPTSARTVGEEANFTITGSNNGNVPLADVVVTDAWATAHSATVTCTIVDAAVQDVTTARGDISQAPGGTLAVGDTYTCKVAYTVTQDDVDGQQALHNEASITGSYNGEPVTATGSADHQIVDAAPDFTIEKTVNGAENATLTLGEKARFVIKVTNTGNVTLKNVAINDTFTSADNTVALVCGEDAANLDPSAGAQDTVVIAAIPPQASRFCVGEYVADQAFVDAQQREVNTAAAVPSYDKPGEDGSVTLTQLDPKTDTASVDPVAAAPSITAKKEVATGEGQWGTTTEGSLANSGATEFKITVANTGNVAVTGITIADTLSGRAEKETLAVESCVDASDNTTVLGGSGSLNLAAGQTAVCSVTVTYTQDDIDAAKDLSNTIDVAGNAKVIGTDGNPAAQTVSDTDDSDNTATVTPPAAKPQLTLLKSTTVKADETLLVGSEVPYTFTVTNNGNVTIKDVTITDPRISDVHCADDNAACLELVKVLPVGETVELVGTYKVQAADVSNDNEKPSTLTNTATAGGTSPQGSSVTSNESSVTVNTGAPRIVVEKLALPGKEGVDLQNLVAGDLVKYQITVRNNGTAALVDGKVTDQMLSDRGVTELTCTVAGREATNGFTELGILAPGEVATCIATVEITQDDVDQSVTISNTAVATGTDANRNVADPAEATATVDTIEDASLELAKTSSATELLVEGDQVSYSFTIRNTGKTTLKDVTITDPALAEKGVAINCVPTELAPGAEYTCTSDPYTVTAEDIAAGNLVNVASYTSVLPSSEFTITPPKGDSNEVTDPTAQPAIELEKKLINVEADRVFRVGDRIDYEFVVTNSGKTKLDGVKLVDQLVADRVAAAAGDADSEVSAVTCADKPELVSAAGGSLEPGDKVTCVASIVVTQADVDAGNSIDNTATVSGATRNAPPVSATAKQSARLNQDDAITLVKEIVDQQALYLAGDKVTYRFTVTNTGQRTLAGIVVDDPMLQAAAATNAGETTGDGTADEDANAAAPAAGGVIVCEDKLTSPGLAAGESGTCTATYTVTETDATAGEAVNTIENVATVSGENPRGEKITSDPAKASFVAGSAELATTKASRIVSGGTDNGEVNAGSVVEWAVTVINGGNAPATDVVVTDEQFAGASDVACYPNVSAADIEAGIRPAADGVAPDAIGSIAAGESVTCFAQTTITQDEVDGGDEKINTATASRTIPNSGDDNGTPLRDTTPAATATVPTATKAGITLTKDVTPETKKDLYVAGDEVRYTFTVVNTGLVTLSDIAVTDPMFAGVTMTCAATKLEPGATTTCTSPVHVVSVEEADADNGVLLNTAKVVGVTPADRSNLIDSETGTPITPGGTVTDEDDKAVAVATPAVKLEKTANTTSGLVTGDKVTYTIVATNIGNAPLENLVITDPWFSANEMNCDDPAAAKSGATLAANGDKVTCEAEKIITQDEVDAKQDLTNTATVKATSNGVPVESTDEKDKDNVVDVTASAEVTVTVGGAPALLLEKSIKDAKELYAAGDKVEYTFTVTNTGSVTLHDVVVTDPMFGDTSLQCTPGTLAPQATASCTSATHVVTVDDAKAGTVVNTATATGLTPEQDKNTPAEARVSATDSATFTSGVPKLEITKSADKTENALVGDTINYSIVITNAGNTPVEHIRVLDDQIVGRGGKITCTDPAFERGEGRLAVGKSTICTATETITPAKLAASPLENTAAATGGFGDVDAAPVSAKAHVSVAARPQALSTKLFISEATEQTQGIGDGNTAKQAVNLPLNTATTITATATNSGDAPLVGVALAVDGVDFAGMPVTVLDDSGEPVTADSVKITDPATEPVTGLVVRQLPDGTLALSDDATLPALILDAGQTVRVSAEVPGQVDPLVERVVKTTATNQETGEGLSASDPLFTSVNRDPAITAKIFGESPETADANTAATAVAVKPNTPFMANVSMTNTSAVNLVGVTVAVTDGDVTGATYTVVDADGTPLAGNAITTTTNSGGLTKPVPGLVLRVDKSGNVVLSADTQLPAVVLTPGQSVTGMVQVAASQIGKQTDITVTAADQLTGEVVTATDPYFTQAATLPTPTIDAKIFVGDTTDEGGATGDGQTPEKAVQFSDDTPAQATIQLSNTAAEPLTKIVPAVEGVTLEEGAEFVLTDAAGNPVAPTAGAPAAGAMLRVTADGKVVFSADESLAPLNLLPGQTIAGRVEFAVNWSEPKNTPISVTAVGVDSDITVAATDALYTVHVDQTPPPLPQPAIESKIFVGEITADEAAKGDGQTADTAVTPEPGATTVTAEITLRNTGDEALVNIVPSIADVPITDETVFTVTDAQGNPVAPAAGKPATGAMLRVTADGKVVFSADETLAPLQLLPGQQVSGSVEFEVSWDIPRNTPITVTAVGVDSDIPVASTDPLYTVKDVEEPDKVKPSEGDEDTSSVTPELPWWLILIPAVAVLPVLVPQLPVPALPAVTPQPVSPNPAPEVVEVPEQPAPQSPHGSNSTLLARTGANVITLGIIAVLLLLAGVFLIAWRRRRSEEEEQA
ncbi:DUF11 domain-containing protein [Corynebacterium choanae]|uniref:DUF7507 domain-containing protein n=1 Tax=Corynebacterium choanae TaxID=1862358 RepID=A0A3G6JEP1_9CORY|nr:DUF11 domain-containing protein [Corynebacterium choanae]AZA14614.1 hypothetical protein CCHOA_11190 [Corynebacterium choanae]